jgi:cytochrome c peroxidase
MQFDNADAAALGHRLFFDERLSASGTVSCATCHDPAQGFSDGRPLAKGEGTGTRHSMTVLNAAHQRWFTWDGRADTLWSQAVQPFETPHEMNMPRARVVQRISEDSVLRAAYRRAFGAEPPAADAPPAMVDAAFAKVGKAIAAYERTLVSGHFIRRFVGYNSQDSKHLFEIFQAHITRLENTVRWRWRAGDVAIWDNRSTQHYAVMDYGPCHRKMERAGIIGDKPF